MGIVRHSIASAGILTALAIGDLCHADNSQPARLYAQTGRPTVVVNDNSRAVRDIAAMQADMRVLQEDQKMLLARIMGLEQELQTRDQRLKELQDMLAAVDNRFEALDREWRQRLDAINAAMEQDRASRRQELETVSKAMAAEILRVEKNAAASRPATAAYSGKYIEIEIQKGDTLGAMATAAGVSIESIRELNGLKNDVIRVGQKLKIPSK